MKRPDPAPDNFEDRLAAQPWRKPLPEWQRVILSTARLAAAEPPSRRLRPLMPLHLRHAWVGLAAVWLALLALHLDTPPAPVYAGRGPRPTLQALEASLRQHQAKIARLAALAPSRPLATSEPPATAPPAPGSPNPL